MADLECRSCGACCVVDRDYGYYADLEEYDVVRLERTGKLLELAVIANQSLPLLSYNQDTWSMRTKERRQGDWQLIVCAAFEGEVGGPCECSIYGVRPQICRAFKQGSSDCRSSREKCLALLEPESLRENAP